MKVLMLAPFPPPSGGIASWTVRYKEYCELHNKSLEIVNISMIGKRASVETKKKNLWDEVKRTLRIINDLRRKIASFNPEIIHLNTPCSSLGILRDALCMKIAAKHAPTILHLRCNVEDQLKGRIAIKAFKYMVSKAHAVIVLNDFSQAYVDAICKNKSYYIPNFVKDGIVAEKHVINEKIKTVISVGHVETEKGLNEILETAKQNPGLQFILVGAVKDNVSSETVPNNVTMTGRVDMNEVQNWLDKSDVFLFPSKTEGFSNALLEAMARGLPCIASDVGANRLMIEDFGGKVLDLCNGETITKAINEMSDLSIRQKMSSWNIDKVRRAYQGDIVMAQYFDLYETVVGKTKNEF